MSAFSCLVESNILNPSLYASLVLQWSYEADVTKT